MKLIVGLGNPGKEYRNSRHNVGFMTVERLGEQHHISLTKAKFQALYGMGRIGREQVLLMKPMTFMNLSGLAVRQVVDFYKLELSELLIIQDDIDIPLGAIRLRPKGSAGTHNGMKSVVGQLGQDQFARLKIGVGSPPPQWDLADFVLSTFDEEERQIVDTAVEEAVKACNTWVEQGLTTAMNRHNTKREKARD